LLAMSYPVDKLSIMVIDDGSRDNTGNIAREYAAKYPQVTYHYKENGGKYTALNYGITHTNAEIIGCLDADSFVAQDGLIEMMKAFEADPGAMALTPAMKVFRPQGVLELMQAVEYTFGIFYKKMFDNIQAINVLPGPFSMYKREVFEQIGLFRHAHNTEDMEITFRMHAHGLKIANAHNAMVYTTVPHTVGALVKQRTRWSQGFLQNSLDYKYMYLNPRFGNFGLLVLPFALLLFVGGLYSAGYIAVRLVGGFVGRIMAMQSTGVPLELPSPHVEWFFLNTSMLTFLIIATLFLTLVAIVLGQRIAQNKLSVVSIMCYFALFGFVAPIWLARAAWGTITARESSWR
jgi:cellulose synthase/poly-beta-1,6-N-acetylglucosamine synthase-like glycosyltransferase